MYTHMMYINADLCATQVEQESDSVLLMCFDVSRAKVGI